MLLITMAVSGLGWASSCFTWYSDKNGFFTFVKLLVVEKVTGPPTVPDEVSAELDAVQVVGLVQTGVHLVIEPHLLKLLPISTWAGWVLSTAYIN